MRKSSLPGFFGEGAFVFRVRTDSAIAERWKTAVRSRPAHRLRRQRCVKSPHPAKALRNKTVKTKRVNLCNNSSVPAKLSLLRNIPLAANTKKERIESLLIRQ